MKGLNEMLQKIKENPKIYLGKISLERLSAFIDGYLCRQYEEEYPELPQFCPGFQEYIQESYGVKSSQSWARIIDFYSESDEEAFYNFFDELEKFGRNRG